jgi:hypothetical protein
VEPSGAEPSGAEPSGAEPSGAEGGVFPMDEDKGGSETPRRARTKKRAIVVSPSEKDKHPARRAKFTDLKVCTHCYSPLLH